MNTNNLKNLLFEYDKKRSHAIYNAEQYKFGIYNSNPKLQEIDNQISSCAISTAKAVLSSNSNNLLSSLNIKINKLKQEKESILNSIGIDSTYFNPHFECALCNDTGYITTNGKTSMCNCLKQKLFDIEYNTFNTYNMANQTFDNFLYTLYSDNVDNQKYNSNISPRENIKLIKKISENFIDKFDNINEKNLLFFGNSGLGKTFISNCIANSLLNSNKTILYQTAPTMLDTIINYRLRKVFFRYKYI